MRYSPVLLLALLLPTRAGAKSFPDARLYRRLPVPEPFLTTEKTGRMSIGRQTANWVHQRILVANFRGLERPRDFLVKLGDTHVAFDDVGMEVVFWNGPVETALLYNGGWLWDLETGGGASLPDLTPPNGGEIHRMGFHHAIAANLCCPRRNWKVPASGLA